MVFINIIDYCTARYNNAFTGKNLFKKPHFYNFLYIANNSCPSARDSNHEQRPQNTQLTYAEKLLIFASFS